MLSARRVLKANRVKICVAVILAFSLSSCADHDSAEGPEHRERASHVWETFPHRLNPGNDGTPYEPCDEVNREAVVQHGWDWSSLQDAASVDGQTARGCAWKDSEVGSVWGMSQIVGNSPSLDAYRHANQAFTWFADRSIQGRQVIVFATSTGTCATRVQSRRAGVSTIVDYARRPSPPLSEICDRAIAFTKATISRMPV
ncbi:DUF3558 family protein [Gordonia crocea]|uniref:DUF3558 domain-containing protein n=1 Tax=Gordonia crocea TaxID=589162 RepID=A0A7I9UWU1_9ACTN|nr:hypothetical protein nbrc107697_13650 [Gordonia crocea]